ncbi:ferredoxin reductase [Subtercola sp. PAMC28395]|uniref:ferredoxin reductase n=1 Tax=Subtercola sp. PAMC28395 TaxID=2846775 RepID=UPI001C0C2A21|nr:ferredoxin reductase [Subtercola sp. PAMC28395]QWT24354.1 ferredoxin reductase [Subtercola sp. PAMC28395]
MVEWHRATVEAIHDETATARTLALRVEDWPGQLSGQHLDLRVTAPDGYQASREYSIASGASTDPDVLVEISIEELDDGEVSPYLVRGIEVGDMIEVRGPVGGYFVWKPEQPEPIQLIAGGSGVVPLMSMLRTHAGAGHPTPMRLLYSVRAPEFVFYTEELQRLADESGAHVLIDYAFTRQAPLGADRSVGRLSRTEVEMLTVGPELGPTTYVCGPNGFVEQIAGWLVELGHPAARVRTERFGGV